MRTSSLVGAALLAGFAGPGCSSPPSTSRAEPARNASDVAAHAPAAAARPLRTGDTLRIGAWNIEWLGTPDSRSGPARGTAQDPNDLATYIIAANVQILGLEEIACDAPAGDGAGAAAGGSSSRGGVWTSSIIASVLGKVEQSAGGDWRHRLFPARSGRNQMCGIAWDASRVTAVGEPVRITKTEKDSSQGKPLWSRPAIGQLFSAGPGLTDVLVVVCHNKSDYGGSFDVHRGEEAELFLSELPAARPDPDLLLIGDMNCDSRDEPLLRRMTAAGWVDLNAADIPTHIRYGPLDRALVPAAQPEFSGRTFEVMSASFLDSRGLSPEEFKIRFSDHFMVVTGVLVGPDDD